MMDIFEKVKELAAKDYNEYLDAMKHDGRKIIGYFCSYVPEEIIHAAGFVPYRMRAVAGSGTAKGDIYFSALNCTFVRNCFNKVMEGDFHFLDGIVFMNGCDHTRRLYDNWRHADMAPDFRYMFVAPHLVNDLAMDQFTTEIHNFKGAVEEHFGVTIDNKKISESIGLYNRKRKLLADIYDLRKGRNVPVKGSEILALLLCVTAMPVENAIELLESFIQGCRDRVVSRPDDLRIFFSSGCIEEIGHMELIEDCGAVIVADNICLGSRHFNLPVDESAEPIRALAVRYLSHLSCPRMMNDFHKRLAYIEEMKKEYAVDAIIAEKLKFCDLWGGELFIYRKDAVKKKFPILALERELYGGGQGQIRTRVQAFFEQVRNKKSTADDLVRASGDNYKVNL